MKHPIRDRFLMLAYALASLCAAVALLAVVYGRITPDMISGWAAQLRLLPAATLKISMFAAAAVLSVLGLALINAMFPPKKKRSSSFAIQQNENGTVRISLKTIDALVQKCLSQHSELKVVSSSLFSDEETVRVDVHIVLLSDISMPLAISALQKQITKYVEACSGVNVREVRIFVDGAMNGSEKAAQSRYALPSSLLGEEIELPEAEAAKEELAQEETAPVMEATEAEETAVAHESAEAEEAQVSVMAPAGGEEAAQEQIPAAEAAEAETEAAIEEEAVAEDGVANEADNAQEEAPAQESVPEKKKLFGLFSRK